MSTSSQSKKPKRKPRFGSRRLWFGLFFGALIAALGCFIFLIILLRTLPSAAEIGSRQINQSTKIYDRTGAVLLYEISGGEKRTVVSFADIPQSLRDATVVTEDERFYQEPAFDWRAILRAFFANIIHGRIVQGASTITQQLAKNAFLSSEQTVLRKIKEVLLAIQLNRQYSKDKILELYLNEIPYGPTVYGAEAASEAYFGKPIKDISVAEAALLAAIPRGPSYYSPWGNHTKELLARQQFILVKMRDLKKISPSEYAAAKKEQLVFLPQSKGLRAPHFVMTVQDYLIQKYGEDAVRTGGLSVTTTLDWNMEQAAEKAVADGAARNESLYGGSNAALVAEDPKTGQILAMVGSRDYFDIAHEGNFNVATEGLRQPGSALKPFVYLTAFEKGYTPSTMLFDVPTEFSQKPACPPVPDYTNDDPLCFHPEDFEGDFVGPVAMRTALAQSINIPAVKTLYLVGLGDALRTTSLFGLSTLTDPSRYGLSLVLGGGEVRLVDLVGAYATLAADGALHKQATVLQVKDSAGNVLESYEDSANQVVDPQYPRLINDILSDPDARSGLFQNSLGLTVFPDHEVALKTGTSNDYRDAWAMGYTPSLAVGVWAGNNDNSPMQRRGSSILAAVPLWHDFMTEALKEVPADTFTRPAPLSPTKPALDGTALGGDPHSILFYVDRANPLGPPPQNPSSDPQFNNWELGILLWEKGHPGQTGLLSPAGNTGAQGPTIAVASPQAGSYFTNSIAIEAQIYGTALTEVDAFFNGVLIEKTSPGSANGFSYRFSFVPQAAASQNILSLVAREADGTSAKKDIVIYKTP